MTIPQQTSASPVDVLAQTESFRTLDCPTLELLVDTADIDQVASGRTLFHIGEPKPRWDFFLLERTSRILKEPVDA